jgi:outer membrane protein
MTKRIISSLASLVLFCTVGSAQKIGYVSTDFIRSQYESARQAEERLSAYVDEWKADMAQKQRDIDELEIEIKKNRLIWSEPERQAKEKEIEEKRRERDQFARLKFEPGGEYDQNAEQLMQAVWKKIYTAIQKVAATDAYDIVWDKSVQPLVYVNAKYDITAKVMKELGIDAGDLEAKQKEAIEGDPRNKRIEEPRKRKSRKTTVTPDSTAAPVPPPVPSSTPGLSTPSGMPETTRTPVMMPDGTMPNGLPPTGQVPGGGPARSMPPPADTTKKPGGGR